MAAVPDRLIFREAFLSAAEDLMRLISTLPFGNISDARRSGPAPGGAARVALFVRLVARGSGGTAMRRRSGLWRASDRARADGMAAHDSAGEGDAVADHLPDSAAGGDSECPRMRNSASECGSSLIR